MSRFVVTIIVGNAQIRLSTHRTRKAAEIRLRQHRAALRGQYNTPVPVRVTMHEIGVQPEGTGR